MPMATEHITHEPERNDAWICVCGNTPLADGFFPCDATGAEVEPTPAAWTTNAYVCARCGRIIDQQSLEVIGQRASAAAS